MIRRRILCALVAGLFLVTSPAAWGCETTDVAACQMSACPLSGGSGTAGCHRSAGTAPGADSMGTTAGSCCDAPLDRDPIDTVPINHWLPSPTDARIEAGSPVTEEGLEPLANSDATVRSQTHELGRYTLLSTFLI
jgi:hypothetical protein